MCLFFNSSPLEGRWPSGRRGHSPPKAPHTKVPWRASDGTMLCQLPLFSGLVRTTIRLGSISVAYRRAKLSEIQADFYDSTIRGRQSGGAPSICAFSRCFVLAAAGWPGVIYGRKPVPEGWSGAEAGMEARAQAGGRKGCPVAAGHEGRSARRQPERQKTAGSNARTV